ncbi:Kelch repeat-containing protein [Hyphobacterium sp.]|uniref:Kelch repeat-containing protein n=1 Tax=Hyphobacterium sp. TaxID=2004662 RepID=UPI003BA91C1C
MIRRAISVLLLGTLSAAAAFADGYWRPSANLPDPRAGLAAAELNGRVYAAGGSGLTEPNNTVEVFDPSTMQWRELSGLPRGLERFGFAALNGRLYAAGGYALGDPGENRGNEFAQSPDFVRFDVDPLGPRNEMWSMDPTDGSWLRETSMPGPKASFQLLALDGRLYAVGGEDGLDGVFVFNPENRLWDILPAPAEIARRGAASVVLNGRIYMIGGVDDGATTGRVDIFDPASGDWTIGPALPAPRAGHAAAVLDGEIHVMGGRSEGLNATLASHLRLDTDRGSWIEDAPLQTPRTDAAAVSLNGELMIIGGGAGGGFFAPFTAIGATEIYSPE